MRACETCGVDISDRIYNAKYCVSCVKARQREHERRWREANPDKVKKYNREYYATNKEKLQERHRRYHKTNQGKAKEYAHRYSKANLEKVKEYKRRWREANPEYGRKYHEANREKMNKYNREYHKANPERVREAARRRRAMVLNQLGSVTITDAERLEAQGGRCAAPGCGKRVKFGGIRGAHRDHIVPLARGGLEDDANLQVLCAPCNLSKHARDPLEFAASRGNLV